MQGVNFAEVERDFVRARIYPLSSYTAAWSCGGPARSAGRSSGAGGFLSQCPLVTLLQSATRGVARRVWDTRGGRSSVSGYQLR